MLASINDLGVGLPKVAERPACSIFFGDQVPKTTAGFLASVSDKKRNDLPRPSTKRYPNPSFLCFFIHKRPQFVQFKHILLLGWEQGGHDVGQRLGFLLIHLRAVWWLMPKVLASPRDELRSWAALTTNSLNSSLLRTVWKTPPKPHALHLYLGFPEPFEPFLTMCSEPHL